MSLRTKLLLTFFAISVAGTLITAFIVTQSNERAVDQLLQEQRASNFLQDVQLYYQLNGSWTGVAQALPLTGAPDAPPLAFALADADGRIILPGGPYLRGNLVPPLDLARGTAVIVDNTEVGVVLSANPPPVRTPQEEAFVQRTNQALLIGALGATAVAVILAVILARTFTQPLQELARASRRLAQGDLAQQVPVRTRDELGDLAAAFNQMSAELSRANRQRRQMTADIAHDLRTPLTVLSGYLEAMRDGDLAPTPARLSLMQAEVHTLTRLVADLRTLSLADAGKLTLQREPVDVGELLTAVVAAYTPQAINQEITLHVKNDANLPPVNLDPARIRQVLNNLVSNALRHTPAGGAVTLAARPHAHQLQLTVADTGSGIPPDDLPYIFDRFYRADKARADGQGASGLGLAIVKSLVAAHGGRITAHSTPGEGTTFTIRLPLQ